MQRIFSEGAHLPTAQSAGGSTHANVQKVDQTLDRDNCATQLVASRTALHEAPCHYQPLHTRDHPPRPERCRVPPGQDAWARTIATGSGRSSTSVTAFFVASRAKESSRLCLGERRNALCKTGFKTPPTASSAPCSMPAADRAQWPSCWRFPENRNRQFLTAASCFQALESISADQSS